MNDRLAMVLEEYDGLLEMHAEYADSVDAGNIEARELWNEIEFLFHKVARRIRKAAAGKAPEAQIDALEEDMVQLSDLYVELGAVL